MTASPRDTWSYRRRHALRAAGLAAALLSGVQCSDAPTANHPQIQLAHRASLAIAPSFATLPSGAPNIPLSKIRGVLQGAGGDSTVTEALFQGDTAILVFTVSFSGNTGTFALALTAYDTSGTAVYFTRDTIEVKPGDNPPVAPPPLQYSGPDASVAKLQITPNPVIMATGATAGLSVVGLTSTGASLPTAPRVGWTSRNASIVTVDATGLLTAGALDGQTYVVARTATNVADSVLVTVKATIATFTVLPNPATVAAGDTAMQLTPHIQDASGHPIVRTVTWSVDHPEIATVSAAGKLQGVKRGSATVTATVEDKTVTVPVTVTSAVDHVTISPATLSFTALGQTQSFTVAVVPHGAASVSGIPVNVGIDNSDVATVAAGTTPGTYVVTAKKVGTATITATADLSSATAGVTVTQVAKTLVVSPKTFSSASQGDTQQFTATVADANGNAMPSSAVTWTSDNTGVVSVDKTGLATTVNDGTAHVIAASGALADTATVTVKRVAVRLSITVPKTTIAPTELMVTSAAVVDANGHAFSTPITWSSSNTGVFTVTQSGEVTGVAGGHAFLQAAGGGMSSGVQITVSSPATMSLNLSTAEKLPNGTQRFYVVDAVHNPGPYTWSVNGVDNGNSTFGTIQPDEVGDTITYIAPSAVPTPATFDVCARQQSNASNRGCASVTIKPVPTSGGDVLVFNDLNVFDNYAAQNPNNVTMFKNLVDYTGSGPRVSQHGVWMYRGHNPGCSGECDDISGNWTTFANTMRGEGYTVTDVTDPTNSALTSIPSSVKFLVLVLPTVNFSAAEINGMKQFSGEGGRILWVGEHQGYYGYGIPVENDFFVKMGAVMRNTGGAVDCGYNVESHIQPHEVTNGLASVTFACVSVVQPGPNDYVLVYALDGHTPLAAVAKVDLTPLPIIAGNRVPNTPSLMRAPAGPQKTVNGQEVHSWGFGPAPKP